ncbi:ssDNA binding protein [Bacillus phage vB_BceH_LY2]|nr:ssDNA binding protein [Bacillus phage vB_BceH_LY2]
MLEVNVDILNFDELVIRDEHGREEVHNIKNELKINEINLEKEMLEQPSKYIYWSSLLEKLKYYQEMHELTLETITARLDTEARAHIESEKKKPTKDVVEAYIKQQKQYITQKEVCLTMEHVIGRVNRIVKAFEQRSQMLQSYGKQVIENKTFGRGAGSRIEDTSQYQQHVNPQIPQY